MWGRSVFDFLCLSKPILVPDWRREEHSRDAAALRKQSSDREAPLQKELDLSRDSMAALRDANLSLEGTVAGLTDREAALEADLCEQKEESERGARRGKYRNCVFISV